MRSTLARSVRRKIPKLNRLMVLLWVSNVVVSLLVILDVDRLVG